jgi:tape measure domain-containing protein
MVQFRIDVVVDPRRANEGTRNVERGLGNVEKKADSVGKALRRAFAFVGVTLLIRKLGQLSDTFINVQNRLKLTSGSAQNLGVIMDELFDISNRTRVGFNATAQIFTRLALSADELGRSQQELLEFTESLNQAVILSGASAIEARGALIQLSQGLALGTLRGDELRSVMEQLPIVADVIARSLGVTRAEVRRLGLDGKITAGIILDAFKEARGELADNFAKTIPTIGQSLQVLGNSMLEFVGVLGEATGGTEGLGSVILDLATAIRGVIGLVKEYKDELKSLAEIIFFVVIETKKLADALPEVFKSEDLKRLEDAEKLLDAFVKSGGKLGTVRPISFVDVFPDPTAFENAQRGAENLQKALDFSIKQDIGIGIDNFFKAVDKGVESLTVFNEATARQQELLREISGPLAGETKLFLEDMQALLDSNAISTGEFNRTLDEMALSILDSSTALEDGFTRAFIRIKQEAEDLASVGEDVVNVFANNATDALVEFAKTGSLNFRDLAISILDDLTRIIARLLVVQALNAAFGGGGAPVVQAAAGGASSFSGGFAEGGRVPPNSSFIVGEKGPEKLSTGAQAAQVTSNRDMAAAAPPQINVQVVNVDDPRMVPAAIEDGQSDEAILNVLARNPQKTNRILGNS